MSEKGDHRKLDILLNLKDEEEREEFKHQYATEPKLFGRWSYEGVESSDISLQNYIVMKTSKAQVFMPHTAGKYAAKRFKKVNCPLVERMVNSLMFKRNNGKKQQCVQIVKQALQIVALITERNPLQVVVDAVTNSGAREDATRIGSAGTVRRQAVDVSPLRRVNQAIYLICKGSREASFRTSKSAAECLADEIIAAATGGNSFALRKKDDIERMAKANR